MEGFFVFDYGYGYVLQAHCGKRQRIDKVSYCHKNISKKFSFQHLFVRNLNNRHEIKEF